MIAELMTKLKAKDSFSDILGQDEAKQQLKSALLSERHIILVGPPGIGKTTLAKNVAKLLDDITVNDCEYHCLPNMPICPQCQQAKLQGKKIKTKTIKGVQRFIRIQGSPDLTVEDLLGDIDPVKALQYGPLSVEAFTPGKIFKAHNGILFFDEVNRCPEKLQNALLQVLEEGKATVSSYTIEFPTDFIFIGTMNPEDSSTEKLSDGFVDRFDFVYIHYPESLAVEKNIVTMKGKKFDIDFPDKLLTLIIHFVRLVREDQRVQKKPSVRASLGLYERSQANAYLKSKKAVSLEDIKQAVISVLSHRIALKPSLKYLSSPQSFIAEKFEQFLEQGEKIMAADTAGEHASDVP